MASVRSRLGPTTLQRANHRSSLSPRGGLAGLLMIVCIVVAAYFLFPLVWLVISTTKSTTSLFSTPIFGLPKGIELIQNLREVSTADGGLYWRWYINSVIYSSIIAIGSTIICALAGYALSKYRFKLRGLFLGMIFVGLPVPGATLTIPLFLLLKVTGLMNTSAAVILPLIAGPFGVYFMNVYIGESMPDEFIDSGRIDGANDFQIFGRIALPVILPGAATLFLIAFVYSWNSFFLPLLVLSDSHLFPVTLGTRCLGVNSFCAQYR